MVKGQPLDYGPACATNFIFTAAVHALLLTSNPAPVALLHVLSFNFTADRVVLSHAGFRTWLATRPQYAQLCSSLGTAPPLSGRQLRKHWPQITEADVVPGSSSGSSSSGLIQLDPAPGSSSVLKQAEVVPGSSSSSGSGLTRNDVAGSGLWGWFQFHTSLYARHGMQRHILQLLQLKAAPQLHAALAAALAELRSSSSSSRCRRPGMLVVAHVRRGDFRELATQSSSDQHSNGSNACNDACHESPATGSSLISQHQQQQQLQLRTEPPFEDGQQGAAWDSNGCDWRAPTAWLLDALAALQLDAAAGDVLWICSDDAVLLQKPEQLLEQKHNHDQQVDEQRSNSHGVDKQQEQQERQQLTPLVATWATVGIPAGLCSSAVTAGAAGVAEGLKVAAAVDAADAALLADWFVMSQADVLLASNSTLSFTAAMVNAAQRLSADGNKQTVASSTAAAAVVPAAASSASSPTTTAGAVETDSASSVAAAAARCPMFLRPDPRQCCYVPFDPWDALPLLPARATLPGNHRVHSERV
jgi:hypothetical protein